MSIPVAYFITWATYGTWLHGDRRGSVNNVHNIYGTPMLPHSPKLERYTSATMTSKPFTLEKSHRAIVKDSIVQTCKIKGWHLHGLHVRTTHIHAVVSAEADPHHILSLLKSWSTRGLRKSGFVLEARFWAEKGSTRYIWSLSQLNRALDYVLNQQGKPMEVYHDPHRNPGA